MRVPTKEEIKQALQIPKATPPLDKFGRANRPTTVKNMTVKIKVKGQR